MKKTVYGIFAALTLVFAFAACDDDSSDIDHGTHARLPEQAIAGSYTGTYTVFKDDAVTVESTAKATITFTAGQNPYNVMFASNCPTNAVLTGNTTVPFNITWQNDDIIFWGPLTASVDITLPEPNIVNAIELSGSYKEDDNSLTLKFVIHYQIKKPGRPAQEFDNYYTFTGTRTE